MKFKSINYSKVFPLGSYINEKIGVEIELTEENESPMDALTTARQLCHEFHEANKPSEPSGIIPQEHIESLTVKPPLTKEEKIKAKEQEIIQDISNCQTIEKLNEYKLYVQGKGREVLKAEYDLRMIELTKK